MELDGFRERRSADLTTSPSPVAGIPDDERALRHPSWTEGEVRTLEVIGVFSASIRTWPSFAYFRQHYHHFFPGLGHALRATFTREVASLWAAKERVWQGMLNPVSYDPSRSTWPITIGKQP
jgi:hypothetical protein